MSGRLVRQLKCLLIECLDSRLTGRKYEDLVNILGISGAGYTPQLFSVVFASTAVVWDLLARSGAKCLVYDEAFASSITSAAVPLLPSLTFLYFERMPDSLISLGDIPSVAPHDTAFIVHSSGTTSGTPKIIPASHLWVITIMKFKYPICAEQGSFEGQNIVNSVGSLAHVGSICGRSTSLGTFRATHTPLQDSSAPPTAVHAP